MIHGQASLSPQGSNLVVTTQNGALTNHSAINWQSFSVPGGSSTHFQQPSTTSLSINRVVGNNPSAIFGTLSSNGRLVLVNPSGIAVGAGAVVDTAGFTASTLRMSDANALTGQLVFGGDGLGGGALGVDGQILARSGDVVLIAPNVQVGSQALVQAPNGATLLAAGQKVELTGPGLEGIRLELQAPTDQAMNLGSLQGDAVGIFAGQLRHSGLIQASAVSVESGKVVLRALGDNLADGQVMADGRVLIEAATGNLTMASTGPVRGGAVALSAGGSILGSGVINTLGAVNPASASRDGSVTVNAGGSIAFEAISTAPFSGSLGYAGGAVTLAASSSITVTGGIYAYGGDGAPGGNGGIVRIRAGGDINIPTVDVAGGYGYSGGNSANGGNGGEISINVGGNLNVFDLYAGGGWGEYAFNGGAGGNGGRIQVTKADGSLVLSNAYLNAQGGGGGDSNSSGSGGSGGAGGGISVVAPAGALTLRDSSLWAGGGWGGFDGSSVPAPAGADGSVQASAPAGVTIEGYVGFGGVWANAGQLNISTSAGIIGGGLFVNDGEINLGSESIIWADRGLHNRSAGRLNLLAGSAFVGLTENYGTVDIATGAFLFTDDFYLNQGTLRVMGSLLVGGGIRDNCTDCSKTTEMTSTTTTTAPPPSFAGLLTNGSAGVISGNGTIDLGGAGTLYNDGTLQPGGAQAIGTLTINGNLNMNAGSVLAIDVASAESYDQVHVLGKTTFEDSRSTVLAGVATSTTATSPAPAQIQVSYLPGASFAAGSQFSVLLSNELSVLLEPVVVGAPELSIALAGDPAATRLMLIASSPIPAPAPASGGSAVEMVANLIGNSALAEAVMAEANNPLATFTALLQQEQEEQAGDNKGLDNLVDNNQCKR